MDEKNKKLLSLTALNAVIASRVQIKSIQLLNSKTHFNPALLQEGMEVRYAFQSKVESNKEEKTISVIDHFQLFVQKEGVTNLKDSTVKLSADYLLLYSVSSWDGILDEHLEAFGKMNGIYNGWPYWREFVQSMTTRMGLPALALPVITGASLEEQYKKNIDSEKNQSSSTTAPTPSEQSNSKD